MSQQKKNAMIEALRSSLGVVTRAAELVGIDRRTHYRWIQEDDEYAEQVKELKEVAIDFAESKLHQVMNDGNVAAIIFYLKTQGKNRGYVEKTELVSRTPEIQWR